MSASVPKGGIAPCSRRVMNLAHFLRQSAKRYPDAVGLVSGEIGGRGRGSTPASTPWLQRFRRAA
jgi:hypothetical protein